MGLKFEDHGLKLTPLNIFNVKMETRGSIQRDN